MSAKLKALVANRATLKSKLTKFETKHEQVFAVLESNVQYLELKNRYDKVVPLLDEFDILQTKIDELMALEDVKDYVDDGEFEDKYFSLTSKVQSKLLAYEEKVKADVAPTENSLVSATNITQNSHSANSGIRLPTINLPKFDGNYIKWLDFKNTYESLIHDNNDIKNVQKFHYLKASLQDSAAQVIKAINMSDENYSIAWEILCERYDNKKLLVHNHIKSIFNLEVIVKESAFKIRKLIDNINTHLKSLEYLELPVGHWDVLLVYIVTSKLDNSSIREWEAYKIKKELPTLDDLQTFLKNRADLLEKLEVAELEKRPNKFQNSKFERNPNNSTKSLVVKNNNISCNYCRGNHAIYRCIDFKNLTVQDRINKVTELNLCENCLTSSNHSATDCKYGPCRKCKTKKHNSLLHLDSSNPLVSTNLSCLNNPQVLLSTISVIVYDKRNVPYKVRALFDTGSQSSFISEELARRLSLRKVKSSITVSGFSESLSNVEYKCDVIVQSISKDFSAQLSCLIVKSITGYLPSFSLKQDDICIPSNLILADPEFFERKPIDILIGSDFLWYFLCSGQLKLGKNLPVLQETKFGWMIAGPISDKKRNEKTYCNLINTLDEQLEKLWELEQVDSTKLTSSEEQNCERHFIDNCKRLENGRFMVSIPLKQSPNELGNSYEIAKRRFISLERKFESNPGLKIKYIEFLKEYERLGHMSKTSLQPNMVQYFMPHHGVLREQSDTTKLRVVFNASQVNTSGLSFNDLQMVGPVLQEDLFSILLRFREHKYAISADCEKMYRMVLVKENQRALQCILFRDNPDQKLQAYQLNTVTYGTASGSFLAIRCLAQLGFDCQKSNPKTSEIILRDFYVDDLITGANSVEEAKQLISDISEILIQGGFKLRKWISNCEDVISNVIDYELLDFGRDENKKTLGLTWAYRSDWLKFTISQFKSTLITKRIILSEVAQIFDPLGFLTPCTITAKIILQKLWQEKISWDDSVSNSVSEEWINFRKCLPHLNSLNITRHVMANDCLKFEVHGFSDASELAYGAAVYVRAEGRDETISVRLLCSKSRVSPLKTCTIPKLELCGALLLAKLIKKVLSSLTLKPSAIFCWCDSTIVLCWLKTELNRLKQFVGNRVADILRITELNCWHHVPTEVNPADLLTTGVCPTKLAGSNLWWEGPPFLQRNQECWPKFMPENENLPELRKDTKMCLSVNNANTIEFTKFSNLNRLIRSFSYCKRFIQNCKDKIRNIAPLAKTELDSSLVLLLKLAQSESFSYELIALKEGGNVSIKSKILNLSPFIDEHGILRVGGRLANSELSYGIKHPILLCSKHPLTILIFKHEHKRLLHAGSQCLLYSVRENYWPIGGKNLARKTVHQCVKCFRAKPRFFNPIMGNLPAKRITPAPLFSTTGTDYAGPYSIKEKKGRGSKFVKGYICLFVCFVTKAIHLELVTDLSSECFLMAFRRFVSRRGKPSNVFSDNGTNYVGANNELRQLGEFLVTNESKLVEQISNEGVSWHFIPSNSPHFGGLWESGVKSTKHHLKRVASESHLTYEEFLTLLVQIEAVLNSRPLTPLSSDPSDIRALTPAHFLVGRPLTTLPEAQLQDIPENRLSRFQRIQQIQQHFWTRWCKEYVSSLQIRTKWKQSTLKVKEVWGAVQAGTGNLGNALTDTTTRGPHFDAASSKNVTALLGKTAYLNCRVKNLANRTMSLQVSWVRHRDVHLLTVGRYTYTSDQRFRAIHQPHSEDWTLQIKYPQHRDSGVYECQVSSTPHLSHFIHLTVIEPDTEIVGGPELFIDRGSTINLTCVVRHSPEPPAYIFWNHNDAIISYSSSRGGVSVATERGETSRSVLLIQRARPTDSGNYQCNPSNARPANVTVHVLNGEHPEAMQHGGNQRMGPSLGALAFISYILLVYC